MPKEDEKKERDEKAEADEAEAEERAASEEEAKDEEQAEADADAKEAGDTKEEARDEREAEAEAEEPEAREAAAPAAAPTQLGYRRFVYGAYFGGAIFVAFLASKLVTFVWHKLAAWKPNFGEPRDEVVMPVAAVLGVLVALFYWRRQKTRRMAEEVAEELSKVTWPSRKEVINGTTVVIVATTFATVFFALMDRFWGFVTDKVYGM